MIIEKRYDGKANDTSLNIQSDQDSTSYEQIIVPVISKDSVTSVMVFVPRDDNANLYQVHSRSLLNRIGNERRFEKGEFTLGALFLYFENLLFSKDEVRIGSGVFKLTPRKSNGFAVYWVWAHDCVEYVYTPDPNNDFWGPNAEPIETTECEWYLIQITTTSDPILG